ncbi:MAG: FxSxx-COOH system tetratricopeptide repeat protein [Chloroflexota bacterium]|nr:toll/interleukin-1 receptor domain-containing protein [Chloroflexota bacterium]MBI5704157.1 toll/interleukin-1 receptor domain-containing protein [Chloroflexota bacterium]
MKFDVFLSHNGKDKPAVEQLARKLEEKGLKVWLDKWNLIPGEPWQEGLEEALDECQTYAVFLGPSGIGPWENEEMRAAIEERVKDKKRRVIPVLLPGASDSTDLKLPRFLSRLTWVDFRGGLNDENALYRLECGIRGIAPKPLQKTGPAVPSANEAIPLPADLPLGSYLPFPPNPLFEGRVPQLRALADSLLNHTGVGTVINQTVTGMGGIGKTQLAVEFAYRYGRYFRGVHWLNLADPSQLEAEIARCGREMRLPDFPEDQPTQVTRTLDAWKSDGPRLLILDNFEEPARTNDVLRLFGHSSLRLLITSRRTDWLATSGLKALPLEVFTPAESLDFLKRTLTKRKDADKDLANLAERLGHLPLALELASRYLNGHPRLALDDYLTQSREALDHPSMHGWRADLPAPTEHDLDLQRTFAVSWLQVKDETAQKIFLMTGYLAPNTPIPLELFENALEISTETCDEALSTLYGLGLLKLGEADLPAIHPLLADYARGLAKEAPEILEKLADALAVLSNQANDTGLPARFVPFRSHMPITASRAEESGLQDAGALWNNYGYHLNMIADYAGARAAYERAIKIWEANLGPDHPHVAASVNNLGLVLKDLGDLVGARAAFERALKIDEATHGPDHPTIASDVNSLGSVLQDLGDLAGARTAFERALKIDEATYGPDHPSVAIRVNNLGSVLQDLGDLAGARAAFERALKIDEAAYGPDHPSVATDVNNLGSVLQDLGDLAGARAAFERAIKIWEANLGTEHPQVATGVNNLGLVLKDLGDLAGARAAFERALKIFEKQLGEDHPNVATLVNNLGSVLKALGDLAGARAACERALAIFKKFLPPDHPNIKIVQGNLDSLEDKTLHE